MLFDCNTIAAPAALLDVPAFRAPHPDRRRAVGLPCFQRQMHGFPARGVGLRPPALSLVLPPQIRSGRTSDA
ncbi:MAG: hypothetical protein ACLVES_01960 [Faecalibacterium prausnitzii]